MKKITLPLLIAALILMVISPLHTDTVQAKPKTKSVICLSIKGNTLTYADAAWTYDLGIDDENIVGKPKKHTLKFASKVSYSLLNPDKMKNYSVDKKKFIKAVKNASPKLTNDSGIKYYWGMAAKITLSGNKITKIKQIYQA